LLGRGFAVDLVTDERGTGSAGKLANGHHLLRSGEGSGTDGCWITTAAM